MEYAASDVALHTDHYELTMLAAALRDGTAERRCAFEVFARRLPHGRRYGVVCGAGRLVELIRDFRFGTDELEFLTRTGVVDAETAEWLAGYRFTGDIDGYAEGELYFPGSPILTVTGSFAEGVVLETLVLSVLNHDCAIASAAARMVTAAHGRPIIEMGSRRAHEEAAIASARAAYLAGFGGTSNLAAGHRYGIPTAGTAAHAFTLLHDSESDAFASQVARHGEGTTLLVDTYDISQGIRNAIAVAGTKLRAIRLDSGDMSVLAAQSRELLDSLGATDTRIVVSGDLDEHQIAALAAEPVDSYGVGTSVVTGSGAPTAQLVYKLVEVDGTPVVKRSEHKGTRGGRKSAVRRHKPTGTATEEVVASQGVPESKPHDRPLQRRFVTAGEPVGVPSLQEGRELLRQGLTSIPWEGLKLSEGDPAVPVTFIGGGKGMGGGPEGQGAGKARGAGPKGRGAGKHRE